MTSGRSPTRFVASFCRENGLRLKGIDAPVYEALSRRKWPGNVRELKNVIERASILSSDLITIADLPEDPHASPFDEDSSDTDDHGSHAGHVVGMTPPLPSPSEDETRPTLREYRERAERTYIVETLRAFDWNISRTAIALGVERTNLHKKIRAYGIKRGE